MHDQNDDTRINKNILQFVKQHKTINRIRK